MLFLIFLKEKIYLFNMLKIIYLDVKKKSKRLKTTKVLSKKIFKKNLFYFFNFFNIETYFNAFYFFIWHYNFRFCSENQFFRNNEFFKIFKTEQFYSKLLFKKNIYSFWSFSNRIWICKILSSMDFLKYNFESYIPLKKILEFIFVKKKIKF